MSAVDAHAKTQVRRRSQELPALRDLDRLTPLVPEGERLNAEAAKRAMDAGTFDGGEDGP